MDLRIKSTNFELTAAIQSLVEEKIGGAMISAEHGNFIVNTGRAKAEEIVELISLIKSRVRAAYGFQLEEEIEYVGFNR